MTRYSLDLERAMREIDEVAAAEREAALTTASTKAMAEWERATPTECANRLAVPGQDAIDEGDDAVAHIGIARRRAHRDPRTIIRATPAAFEPGAFADEESALALLRSIDMADQIDVVLYGSDGRVHDHTSRPTSGMDRLH